MPAPSRLVRSFAVVLCAAPLRAQDAAPPPPPRDPRVGDLEQRVADLEDLLFAGAAEDPGGHGLTASYGDVRATFQVFGDVGWTYRNPAQANRGNDAFGFGFVDFFATAQIGDHFQVLSETALGAREGESHFDQERLWGQWTVSDAFYAKLGVEHSPLARWNRRYHHGAWLEPTITRPLLAGWEGSADGILPLHNTGLELGGSTSCGAGRIEWFAGVHNGRGYDPAEKQRFSDKDDEKAFTAGASFAPASGEGPRFGLAAQYDTIPANPASADPLLQETQRQLVGTVWIEDDLGPLTALLELGLIEDDPRAGGESFTHEAGYLQIGWPRGDWTPYARFDRRDMEQRDPFYKQVDRDLDKWQQVLGVRYDFAANAAIKLEVGFGEREMRDGLGNIVDDDFFFGALQLAWVL